MQIRPWLLACTLWSLCGIPSAIAAPLAEMTFGRDPIHHQEIASGPVRVVVTTYTPKNFDSPEDPNLSYEIYINNELKAEVQDNVWMFGSLRLENLDPDGVPEVIAEAYTGGAHCCTLYTLYSWRGDRLQRTQTRPLDASAAGNFQDLDGDGYSEFLSADGRFLYAFSSYAGSWPPAIILSFQDGTLVDATKHFSNRMRSQAFDMYTTTRTAPSETPAPGVNGVLAGFVAQNILLGEYEAGWNHMLAHYDPTDTWGLTMTDETGDVIHHFDDYPAALTHFLIEKGYLVDDGTPNTTIDLTPIIVEAASQL